MSWARPSSAKAGSITGPRQPIKQNNLGFSPPVSLPDTLDSETGCYSAHHFESRLSDEVKRATQHGNQLTLVYFRLPITDWAIANRLRQHLTVRLGLLQQEVDEGTGFFGRLSEDEFAVCVSHTDSLGAAATVMVLLHTLSGLSADTAVASFPEDADDGPSLIESARAELHRELNNIVYLDEYRQRRSRRVA